MKKLISAAVIVAVIITGIIFAQRYMLTESEKMVAVLRQAEYYAKSGDDEEATKYLDTFSKQWDVNKKVWCTFIMHEEIDIANQSAAKLKPYLADDNKSNFFAECEALKFQINHIAQTEQYTVDNIL